jgi:hypothetical protein
MRRVFTKDIWLSVTVAVGLIALGLFLGWANNKTIFIAPHDGFHYVVEPHNPLSYFASWDAPDYLSIARHGYTSAFWINWFPLYPLAIHALDYAIPSPLISAFLISWASLVGAIYFYIKIVRRLFKIIDALEPLRAVVFFVLFPTGVFLLAPFTESLYAFLALGAVYYALQKRYLAAGLLSLLCTATHVTGMAVVILVALILLEEKVQLSRVLVAAALGSLGLVSYMVYLAGAYHDPLGFLTAQKDYHEWTHHGYLNLITSISMMNLILIVLLVASGIYWWKRRRSFAIYSLLYLAIPLFGRQYGGFDRYVLMVFPIQFMFYAVYRERRLYQPIIILFAIAWTYYLLQYSAGYIGS